MTRQPRPADQRHNWPAALSDVEVARLRRVIRPADDFPRQRDARFGMTKRGWLARRKQAGTRREAA